MNKANLDEIKIRRNLVPGDLGYIAYVHGLLYFDEYRFDLKFESYVLKGLYEFAAKYDEKRDGVWICEHNNKIVGCLIAMECDDSFQLRYFVLQQDYRNLGLGKWLVGQFVLHVKDKGSKKAFLWTTNEQLAAISLYERYGFRLAEEKESTAFGRLLTELRYDLNL